MEGSRFPNGVRVDHSALRYTETTKADEILRGRVNWTSRGILSGFVVSVNAVDNTLIDVALGSGFAPNGEFLETTSNYFSISLDDYTLSVVNYVCIVYTESNTHDQPHESNSSTYPTRAEMAWRVRVYDATAYAALSATDANLANDARDRMLVVAKVTANGAGIALTSNSITSSVDFDNILYATPNELATITGVTVMSISPDTGSGTGTLSYTYAIGPVYTFTWTSAVGGVGAATVVNADGYWNIPDGLGEYIRVYIVLSQLPTAGTFPMTESVAITNLYYQAIPRLTGEDTYHRNLLGTGVVSLTNPHGTSISDLAGDALPQLEEHQDIMHCNGIWNDATANILLTSVVTTPPTADTLNIQVPAASDLFYINGNKLNSVNNSSIPFTPWQSDWTAGMDVRTNFFEIYVTDAGDVKAHRKATYPATPRNLKGTWIVDMSPSYPAGNYNLIYGQAGANTYIEWDGGTRVLLWSADFGVVGNSRVIRLFDAEGVNWIDLWVNMDDPKAAAADDQFNNAVGPLTDIIAVTASPDWDANMQIASLVYWYDAGAPKGKLGYAPNTVTRRTIDKRPFGTLCTDNIADKALQDLVFYQQDELNFSGVLLDRGGPGVDFVVDSTAALGMTITGGNYYCRGQRLQAAGATATLVDNTTNLVWLDMGGSYNVIDVTTTFSGDLQEAMKYVLGGAAFTPAIDDDTHSTELSGGTSPTQDPPERGVLLYYAVTSGGAISYYEDIMRNVNGPVDPWSVGKRHVVGSALQRLAAFDSLNAAFEYATLENALNGVTIRIVGPTVIANRRILQPEGTRVVGGTQSTKNIVTISYVDTDGVWCLSSGCTVSNVNIVSDANSIGVFGVGSSLVSTAADIIIEGCKFDCLSFTTGSHFVKLNEAGFGGSYIDNLTVKDNTATVGVSFISYINSTIDFRNINIYHNNIEFSGTAAVYAISLYSNSAGYGIRISDNYISGGSGIYLRNSTECSVSNNSIVLSGSGGGAVIGAFLLSVDRSTVTGNTFYEDPGSTSTNMTGIRTDSLLDVTINDNVIRDCHYGVYDLASGNSFNMIVSNNTIRVTDNGAGAGGTAILTYCDDVVISNNKIYCEANGIGLGPNTGVDKAKVIGNIIKVKTDVDGELTAHSIGSGGCYGIAAADYSIDVDIENNQIELVGPSKVIKDDSACIFVRFCEGFTIKGNTVSADGNSLSGGAGGAWQIYAHVTVNCDFIISENKVDNRNNTANPSPMHGLYFIDAGVGTTTVAGKISGNLIDGSNDTGDSNYEFFVNVTGSSLVLVTDNVICDLTATGIAGPKWGAAGPAFITQTSNALINDTGLLGNI